MGIFFMWAHEYMDIFLNIDGHRMWGRLTRAGCSDFDNTWSAFQSRGSA